MLPTLIVGIMITQHTPLSRIDAFVRSFALPTPNYYLKPYFVMGRSYKDTLQPGPEFPSNTLILDIKENIDKGKTFAWFSQGIELFHDVPFHPLNGIVKMDVDISANWTELGTSVIPKLSAGFYLGRVNDNAICGGSSHCPPVGCNDFSGNCWIYMSGGWYGLGLDLAKSLINCDYANNHRIGWEDLMVGKWIKHCSAGSAVIYGVENGDFFCHSNALTDEEVMHGSYPNAQHSRLWMLILRHLRLSLSLSAPVQSSVYCVK
jgi:hypothetical protein